VIDYQNADTLLYKMSTNSTIRSLAGTIKEARLLSDRGAYHICQTSPRRCSIIRRSSLVGKRFCEFDVMKAGLTPQEADDLASQLNRERSQMKRVKLRQARAAEITKRRAKDEYSSSRLGIDPREWVKRAKLPKD
jgi:hypothetical protein